MTKISIIIPILNEAETIASLLNYLLKNVFHKKRFEIIVVDGGSHDGSQEIISKFKNITLVHSEKGRAKQMNTGSKNASGNILYFLHADSFPPKNFDNLIIDEVNKGHLAGCFKMQFDSNHWWLQLMGWFTKFPWFICRGGDQSLFVTKELFQKIGGFNESYIIYEDNVFIKKLFKATSFKVIQKTILTSDRLYKKHGVWKLQYHFFMVHLKYWMGAKPETLHAYYQKHIANSLNKNP